MPLTGPCMPGRDSSLQDCWLPWCVGVGVRTRTNYGSVEYLGRYYGFVAPNLQPKACIR
jgi:hypothetical protein